MGVAGPQEIGARIRAVLADEDRAKSGRAVASARLSHDRRNGRAARIEARSGDEQT